LPARDRPKDGALVRRIRGQRAGPGGQRTGFLQIVLIPIQSISNRLNTAGALW
jgi:hypothetical protein